MKTIVITLLYFASCPNYKQTLELISQAIKEKNIQAQVQVIEVKEDEIYKYYFLGSPTVQVNGKDIEVSRRGAEPVFSCRFYPTDKGLSGIPPKKMLEEAIDEALGLSHSDGKDRKNGFQFKTFK